ncbi:unnamed protein product, partial [Dibothriocephalus latus]
MAAATDTPRQVTTGETAIALVTFNVEATSARDFTCNAFRVSC